jgi:hypothetical protein
MDSRNIASRTPARQPSSRERAAADAVGFGGRLWKPGWHVIFSPERNQAKTCLGWLTIKRPSGEISFGHKLMISARGKRWVTRPTYQISWPDGSPRLIKGRVRWARHQAFDPPGVGDVFQKNVLAVLRAEHPEFFVGDPEQ